MRYKNKNIVIVLGPTAVGKSATAIEIAKRFSGEIINCDSMQVYRGFDIGTDKISPDKTQGIPHHLLDIMDPSNQFNAADFIRLTLQSTGGILDRGHVPIIAGGTGLYLKALIEGLFPEGEKDKDLRRRLEAEAEAVGLEEMWRQLTEIDPEYAQKTGPRDKVRIIRALEVFYSTDKTITEQFSQTRSPVEDYRILKIGLELERAALYARIEDRVDRMFDQGIVEETRALLDSGIDPGAPPFRALGYKHVLMFLNGEAELDEAIELTKRDTRHYAKRQMTWFRKMEGIHWFPALETQPILDFIQTELM